MTTATNEACIGGWLLTYCLMGEGMILLIAEHVYESITGDLSGLGNE